MRGDILSVFIEANRFPPAINGHRYSILRAESDAVADRLLIIVSKNKKDASRASHSYASSDMNRLSGNHIYELEANQISAVDQCPAQSLELPVLPRISVMSAFNPFDEQLSSPPSPVPNQLKPATEADTLPSSPLTSRPPTNYLPFIPPTAPFDPYKEKYEPHPAGPYGAKKFKNRQTLSSAPFGFERPVTPTFSDTTSSFLHFSDTNSPTSPDQAGAGAASSPSTSQISCSPPRTPLFRPFKIPRKPLPPGAKPFPPVSYTPPGSPIRHDSHRNTVNIETAVPQRPHRAPTNTARVRSPSRNQTTKRKPGLDVHKHLPPSPSPARPANTSQSQNPAPSSNSHSRRVSRPSDHGMQVLYMSSAEYIARPVTAADRVRSELRNVKERALDRIFKLRRS
ncbi:hypothetical protein M436DRAFT_83822 [Aureobasidium namibiae CBS 147.97]|uniref:Uncharacterized protein n=1 Tax=Aureobasidium namibiae CBS 147.97 TaxID=1043004 RepID=A0A074WIW6_9PEZI